MTKHSRLDALSRWTGRHRALFALVFVILLGLLNRDAIMEWSTRVVSEERYSHIPLLIPTILYLAWARRQEIRPGNAGAGWGLAWVIFSALLLFAGELSAIWTLVQYGIVGLMIGMAWCLIGSQIRKFAWLAVLIAMCVPLPYMIDVMFTGKMQLLSSELGAAILRVLDVPVYLEGNVLDFGSFKLQVVEACSGLNYAFPLLTIGVLFAYLYDGPMLSRLLLIVSTLPITIAMNSARIAVVGLLVNASSIDAAAGFMHYFEGWVVFLICILLLFAEAKLLDRLRGHRGALLDGMFARISSRPANPDAAATPHAACNALMPALAFVGVLGIALALSFRPATDEAPLARHSLTTFPVMVGDWFGLTEPFRNNEDKVLGLSDYAQINYSSDKGHVGLYIGYTTSQRNGFVPHSPQACIPGGGWNIDTLSIAPVVLGNGHTIRVTRLQISRGHDKQIVYYWYRQRGHDLSNEYSMKFSLFKDAIVRHRTDGAIVRLTSPVTRSVAATEENLRAFMDKLYPMLPDYIPD